MATKRVNIDIVAKDKSQQALNRVRGSLDKVKASVFNVRNALAGLGAGLVIRNLVNTGQEIESLQVRLKFLFGTAEEGAKAFDNMAKFAAKVPFSLEQIQQGAGVLAVVSKDADELSDVLKITGNVAAVTGLDFRTTAEQIQRSLSAGISSADLFRERGVKAMLGFSAGATVSVEQTVEAFNKVFGPNGEFGRATDELAKTFEGTLSMIQDSIFEFKKEVADAGLFDFVKFTAETVDRAIKSNFGSIEKFAERTSHTLIDAFENIALGFVHLGSIFQTPLKIMMDGVKELLNFLANIPEPFRSFGIIGFLALGFKGRAAVILVGAFFEKIQGMVEGLAAIVGETLTKIDADFEKTFNGLRQEAKDLASVFATDLAGMADFSEIESDFSFFEDARGVKLIKKFFSEFRLQVNASTETLGGFLNNLKTGDKTISNSAEEVGKLELAYKSFKDGFGKSMEEAGNIQKQFTSIGKQSFKELKETLTDFVFTGKLQFQDLARTITKMIVEALIGQAIQAAVVKAVELFKASAIRDALISVYKAGLKAFSSVPFPFNFAAMGATVASGLAVVNKIRGFQHGGVARAGQPAIVGENGPELIMPEKDARVIPNNQMSRMGQPINVNFNINTVDARGFNELLVNSRGVIINMINSAVNEKGKMAIV